MKIKCPECNSQIDVEKIQYSFLENRLKVKLESGFQKEKEKIIETFKKEKKEWKKQQAEELNSEIEKHKKKLEAKITKEMNDEQLTLLEEIKEKEELIHDLRLKEKVLLKRERQVEDKEAELSLQFERELNSRLSHERKLIETKTKESLIANHDLELKDAQRTIENLTTKLKEIQIRAEKKLPVKTLGDAQENHIESQLKQAFPEDIITVTKSGARGADILQEILVNQKQMGSILFESKRVKNFQRKWVTKLKEDQRKGHADVAIIVCQVMPKDSKNLCLIDGIWVVSHNSVIEVCRLIRSQLIHLYQIQEQAGTSTKEKERIHKYLISIDFKQHLETLLESLLEIKSGLDRERIMFEENLSRKEKNLQRAILSVSGFYGELRGITTLPDLKGFKLLRA